MARQIVLQHGGIMWADPLPAGGTRVSFVIPAHAGQTLTAPPRLAEADAERSPEAAAPGSAPAADDSTVEGGTVVPFHQRTPRASSS
jgi:hypothetical protein